MRVVLLGTSAGVPTLRRNLSSMVLERDGELLLFDCGEGTQIQIRRSGLRWGRLAALFVSHLHADHVTGLPGLLLSLSLAERRESLPIIGPRGIRDYVRCSLRLLGAGVGYPLEFREVDGGPVWEGAGCTVAAAPLDHRVPCLGYALREHVRPGEFHLAVAQSIGIPPGPLFGQLQRGETIVLADGRAVAPSDVLGPPRPGRTVAYCTDTRPCDAAVELAHDADLLIHEATFEAGMSAEAHAKGHSTTVDAAEVARGPGARRLVLTHVSPRYERSGLLRDEARAVFAATDVAEDLMAVDVPRRGEETILKFAICNETFQNWEWPRICEFVAQTGYQAVEIAPFTLAEDATTLPPLRRREIRRAAESNGLAISGLHWLLVSPPGLSLNGPDDTLRRRTGGFLIGLIGLAADLGADRMVLGSPKQRWVGEDDSYQSAWSRTVETVELLTPALEDAGVILCLEPLPAPESNFLLTIDEAIRLAQEIDHPNVKVIADVKSLCAEGDPSESIRRIGSGWIEYVHANDANRRGPGFGDVDFTPIAHALQAVGYDGTVSVEVFDYAPDPETIARASLRTLRAAFGVSAES